LVDGIYPSADWLRVRFVEKQLFSTQQSTMDVTEEIASFIDHLARKDIRGTSRPIRWHGLSGRAGIVLSGLLNLTRETLG